MPRKRTLKQTAAVAERKMIRAAIRANNGNKRAAARDLNISAQTIYNKLATT